MNSLGFRKIRSWKKDERNGWKKKIELLHATAGREPRWERAELQFAEDVFEIRHSLAHGKGTSAIAVDTVDEPAEPRSFNDHPWPPWLRKLDIEWAVASRFSLEASLSYLGELFGYDSRDHLLVSDSDYEEVQDDVQ